MIKVQKNIFERAYIPMNFNLQQHIEAKPPHEVKGFNFDNLKYILSLLTTIPARAERHEGDFVNLRAEFLRNRVRNYKQYLDYAIRTGIIETDNHYQPGEKSKGYRFTKDFLTYVKRDEITKYSLIKRGAKDRELQRDSETEAKYNYLTKWFDENLHFYSEQAEKLLLSNATAPREYNYNLVHIDELIERKYRYSVDKTANRFHSNLTNLKTDFRQYLTYGTDHLVSVDISNSQPFFSLVLLNKKFWDRAELNSVFSLFNSDILDSKIIYSDVLNNSNIPLMMYKSLQGADYEDIKHYGELVLNGTLYEYLAREAYDQIGLTYDNRQELKKDFFWGFYSPNQTIGHRDAHLRRIFRDRFPNVYKLFSILKKKDHRFFPVLLQRIESHIVLERICPRIAQARPLLPIYTIHDSIATIQGNEGFIASEMENTIKEITGNKPTLKLEKWKRSA